MNDDGTYATSGWKWIDGNTDGVSECYYFDNNGYLISDTTIDGYQINSDGAWIVNGVVQTKQPSNVTCTDADWKQAYINYLSSLSFLHDYDEGFYNTFPECWDYAYINDDMIPELICNIPTDLGWVYTYFNGNVLALEGGQSVMVSYKSGGNLIYSSQETRHSHKDSYRIGTYGFELIHSSSAYEYMDKGEYTFDDVIVTEAQYRAAMAQYFSDPDMMNTPGLFEPPVRNLRATIPDG